MISNIVKNLLKTSLSTLHNYLDSPTKFFSNLYPAIFLDTSAQNHSFRVKCNLYGQVIHVGSYSTHWIKWENVSFLRFPEKAPKTRSFKSFRLSRWSFSFSNKCQGRNVISAPNKIIKISFCSDISRTGSLVTVTETAIDLLRKSANAQ